MKRNKAIESHGSVDNVTGKSPEGEARLWHFNGKAYKLSQEADSLPEQVKMALMDVTDDQRRWCVASHIFLDESVEGLAVRLRVPVETAKDHVIAGCKHLLLKTPLHGEGENDED
jgi:hypothetical protein